VSPETVDERSARLSALVEHAYARPVRFTLGLFARALPFWVGAALLALWIRFDRTLVLFFGTLIAAAFVMLIFGVETYGVAIAWMLASYGSLLLLYWVTRLRPVNDFFIRRIDPVPRCADGALLAPLEAPALEALIERAANLTGGHTLIATTISVEADVELVEEVQPGSLAWRATRLSIGLPMLLSLTSAQLEARIVWLLTMRTGGIAGLIRFVELTLGLRSWLDRMTLPRYGGVLRLVDRLETHLQRTMGEYRFSLGLMGVLSADARAALLVGADRVGESFCAVVTYATFTVQHWLPAIWKKTIEHEEPPERFYRSFRDDVRSIDLEEAKLWVSEMAHHDRYDLAGTPPLGRRLAELGVTAAPPEPATITAADELFDASYLDARLERTDAMWREEVRRAWRQRHELESDHRELLAQLEAERLAGAVHGEDDLLLYAELTETVAGPERALEEYRRVLERYPDNVPALAETGRLMIGAGDDGGVALLDRAIEAQPEQYLIPGYQLVFGLAANVPGASAAAEMRDRRRDEFLELLTRRHMEDGAIRNERETLLLSEELLPHGVSDRDIRHLRRKLERMPLVSKAYLVRRDVEHLPHIPSYVLGVVYAEFPDDLPTPLELRELGERIVDSTAWLGEVHVVADDDPATRPMIERMSTLGFGACVFRRDGSAEEDAGDVSSGAADEDGPEDEAADDAVDDESRYRVGSANAFGRRILHAGAFVVMSWVTFAPFGKWSTALLVFAVGVAILAFLLRRGISWVVAVGSLVLTPYFLYPVGGFVRAIVDYSNGTAALLEAAPAERFGDIHWNDLRPIDPRYRVRWRLYKGGIGPHSALVVSSYNFGVRTMIEGFGPADGAYDGPLPSPDEARSILLRSGRVVQLIGARDERVERRGDTFFIPQDYVRFYRVSGFIASNRTIVGVIVDDRLALYGSRYGDAILYVVGLDVRTGERIVSYR